MAVDMRCCDVPYMLISEVGYRGMDSRGFSALKMGKPPKKTGYDYTMRVVSNNDTIRVRCVSSWCWG